MRIQIKWECMKKLLNYRNIVTFLIFLTIWGILFSVLFGYKTHISTNRYQLFKDSDNTILLDRQTGMTWRNVWNNSKEKIPCQWEYMEHTDKTNLPIGPKILYYADEESSYNFEQWSKRVDYDNLNKQDKKYVKRLSKADNLFKKRKIVQEMKAKGYKKEQFEKLSKISDYIGNNKNFWTEQLKPYKYVFY